MEQPTPTPDDRPVTGAAPAAAAGEDHGRRGRSGCLPEVLVEGPAASSELLVELIDTLRSMDRMAAKATALLELAHDTGEVEEVTGVPVELWLSAAGRRTRSDRRMLSTVAVWRKKLPALMDAFDEGRVSWAQVRAVVCACVKLPSHLLPAIDEALAAEVDTLVDAQPDDLVHVVSQTVASLERPSTPSTSPDEGEELGRGFLAIQPRLDGTGGSLYGETDSYGLAVLTDALEARMSPPAGRVRDRVGEDVDPERAGPSRREQGRRRMAALVELAEASLTGGPDASADAGAGTDGLQARRPLPTLLLTMSAETLLGVSSQSAELLTTLTGGRLKVDAATARRLVDDGGVQLRTVVVEDTGQIVGVGRRQYRPPGWLREALLVRDATCRAPGCRTAARHADLDHAVPWTRDDGPPGTTDVVNLAHVCRTDHGAKDRGGWQVHGRRDGPATGLHRWHHPRSGLTIDTAPATRRLPLSASTSDPDPPGDPP